MQYDNLDHVACKVEELLEKNPSLSLDDVFRQVYGEFGVFGFSGLAESYTKSIENAIAATSGRNSKGFLLLIE